MDFDLVAQSLDEGAGAVAIGLSLDTPSGLAVSGTYSVTGTAISGTVTAGVPRAEVAALKAGLPVLKA